VLTPRIINIFSRKEMETFLRGTEKLSGIVVISITDPDLKEIDRDLLSKADDFLVVKFWDIDEETDHPIYKPIDRETAKKVAEFIWKNREKKFLINCEGGESRSAGVGLAVECIVRDKGNRLEFSWNGCSAIVRNPRFRPNWYVFNRIVEEFVLLKESWDEQRVSEKS